MNVEAFEAPGFCALGKLPTVPTVDATLSSVRPADLGRESMSVLTYITDSFFCYDKTAASLL